MTETSAQDIDAQAMEASRRLFAQPCDLVISVAQIDGLPDTNLVEIAFAGRSNVGKSSLLNALTNRNSLARTSNTPGRTQTLNFFNLGDRLILVDLPGYGYARVSRQKVAAWTRLVHDYLRGRQTLRRLCLLVDARHGLKDSDGEVMVLLDQAAVAWQLILTKADKVPPAALMAVTICLLMAPDSTISTISTVAASVTRRPST
jgi:GTP-binding protein